jgi:hypothetical protein
MSHLNIDEVRLEALFVSALQRSAEPTAAQVRAAIRQAVRRFGSRGCAALMAQEYGDHPDTAAVRMRWARQVVAEVFPAASSAATGRLPVEPGDGDRKPVRVPPDERRGGPAHGKEPLVGEHPLGGLADLARTGPVADHAVSGHRGRDVQVDAPLRLLGEDRVGVRRRRPSGNTVVTFHT